MTPARSSGEYPGLDALVKRYGGFVESSSLNGSNYYSQSRGYAPSRSADFVLRIPSARFSELMNSLSELGNVPYSHTYTGKTAPSC